MISKVSDEDSEGWQQVFVQPAPQIIKEAIGELNAHKKDLELVHQALEEETTLKLHYQTLTNSLRLEEARLRKENEMLFTLSIGLDLYCQDMKAEQTPAEPHYVFVHGVNKQVPSKAHASLEIATKEAQRLARKEAGLKVSVMKPVSSYQATVSVNEVSNG